MSYLEAQSMSKALIAWEQMFGKNATIVLAFHAGIPAIKAIGQIQTIENWGVVLMKTDEFWTPTVDLVGLGLRDGSCNHYKVLFARGVYICTYAMQVFRLGALDKLYLHYLLEQRFKIHRKEPLGLIL
jgi:hypothetical protein